MPKAAKCLPSRGKGGPRGGGRSGASTASGSGRRVVAGKGRPQPRNDDRTKYAPDNRLWHERVEQLAEFKRANGHCNVPWGSGPLGNWVNDQRRLYREGKLAQDRIDRLNDLRFSWSPDDDRWNGKFKDLKDFKEGHGHCRVPKSHGQLGIWVNNQRRTYRKESLAQKYVDRLEDLGFEWNPGPLNQWTSRKRDANVISDGEDVISDAEPCADEGAPARAANNSEDVPSSRTSHVADGPSEHDQREERRRRWEQRREISVANSSEIAQSDGDAYTESEAEAQLDSSEQGEGAESAEGNVALLDSQQSQTSGSASSIAPASRTSHEADGPIEQDPRAENERRRRKRRRSASANPSEDGRGRKSKANVSNESSVQNGVGNEAESGEAEESQHDIAQFATGNTGSVEAACPEALSDHDDIPPLSPLPPPPDNPDNAAVESAINGSSGSHYFAAHDLNNGYVEDSYLNIGGAAGVVEFDESNQEETMFVESDGIDAIGSQRKRAAMLTLSAIIFVFVAARFFKGVVENPSVKEELLMIDRPVKLSGNGIIFIETKEETNYSSVAGIHDDEALVAEPVVIDRSVKLAGESIIVIENKKETNYSPVAGVHDDKGASAPDVSTAKAVALRANDNLRRDGISSFDVPWQASSKISSVKYDDKQYLWSYAVSSGSKLLIDDPNTQRRWLFYTPLIGPPVKPQSEALVAILQSTPEVKLHTVPVNNKGVNENKKLPVLMGIKVEAEIRVAKMISGKLGEEPLSAVGGADDTSVQKVAPGNSSAAKSIPEKERRSLQPIVDAVDDEHNEPVPSSDHLIADEGASSGATEDRDVIPGEEEDSAQSSGKVYLYEIESGRNSCGKTTSEANDEFVNKKEKNYHSAKDDEQHDVLHHVLPGGAPDVERGEQPDDLRGVVADDHQGEHGGIVHDGHNEHMEIPSLQGFHKSEGAPAADEGSSYASTDHDRDKIPDKEKDSSKQSSGSGPPSAASGKGYSNKQESRENSQARSDVGENDGFFADGKGADKYEDSKSDQPLFGSPILKEIWRLLSQASFSDVLIILCCGSILFSILSTALFHGRVLVNIFSPQFQFVYQGSINYGQAASHTPQEHSPAAKDTHCAVDALQCESTDPTAPTEISQYHSNQRSSAKESEQKRETDSQRQRREREEEIERKKASMARIAIDAVHVAKEFQQRRENVVSV